MKGLRRFRPSGSMLVALLALVMATTGSAVAASLITSKQIKDGTIQTKDISKKAKKALKGNRGAAGPQGAQGAQGAQGPQGTKGDPGAKGDKGDKGDAGTPAFKQFARIEFVAGAPTVTLASDPGITVDDAGFANGAADVNFVAPVDVDNCTFSASLHQGTFAGFIRVSDVSVDNEIRVFTADTSGTATDRGFDIIAFCP